MHIVHLIIQIVPLNVLAFLATLVIRKLEIYASMAKQIGVLEELLEVHVCVAERIQVLLILIHIGVGNEYSSENLKSFYNNKNKALSSERALFYLYFAVAMFVFLATAARAQVIAGNFAPSVWVFGVKLGAVMTERFVFFSAGVVV